MAPAIYASTSTHFHNKQTLHGKRYFAEDWRGGEYTPEQITDHIIAGGAWSPAIFHHGQRNRESFVQAQTIALDCDSGVPFEDICAFPFVRDYAFLVHHSSSSKAEYNKVRILFQLDQPITHADTYEAYVKHVLQACEILGPDIKATDAPRMFFGSDTGIHTFTPQNILPIAKIQELPPYIDENAHTSPNVPRKDNIGINTPIEAGTVKMSRQAAEAYVKTIITDQDNKIKTLRPGERHGVLTQMAAAVFPRVNGGWPGLDRAEQIERFYSFIPILNTLSNDPFTREEMHGIIKWADKLSPVMLEIEQYDPLVHSPGDKAEVIKVHEPYLSLDMIPKQARTTFLLSGLGTGKTSTLEALCVDLTRHGKTFLVINHRELLSGELANRLNKALERAGETATVENYKEIPGGEFISSAPRLVICLNSVKRLKIKNGKKILPKQYDYVIVEEAVQTWRHLAGKTFGTNEGGEVYAMLKNLIREAEAVVCMDAHMNSFIVGEVLALRGEDRAYVIQNTHKPEKKKPLYIYPGHARIPAKYIEMLEAGERVHFFGTRNVTNQVTQRLRGKYNYMLINSDTSQAQADFLQDVNGHIGKYDTLIYSPSLGSGIDIQEECILFVCVRGLNLTAADVAQGIGRMRNVKEVHVFFQTRTGGGANDEEWHLNKAIEAAELTASLTLNNGEFSLSEAQLNHAKLCAKVNAQDDYLKQWSKEDFEYLMGDSFEFIYTGEEDTEADKEAAKSARNAQQEEDKIRVMSADEIDQVEYDKIRDKPVKTQDERDKKLAYEIRQITGGSLTEEEYNLFAQYDRRIAFLDRIHALHTDNEILKQKDWPAIEWHYDVSNWQHFTARAEANRALVTVLGDGWHTREDFIGAVERWAADYRQKWDTKASAVLPKKPEAVAKRVLHSMGLQLEKKRQREGGEKRMFYRITDTGMGEYVESYVKNHPAQVPFEYQTANELL